MEKVLITIGEWAWRVLVTVAAVVALTMAFCDGDKLSKTSKQLAQQGSDIAEVKKCEQSMEQHEQALEKRVQTIENSIFCPCR